MNNRKTKKQQGAFHKNLEIMTNKRIEAMQIMDSEKFIRLLRDPKSGFYVIFNGRFNQSIYSKSYQAAEKHYNHLVAIS